MLDFAKAFLLECDALGRRIRVVLIQEHRIAFFSRALFDRSLSKSTYEKEMMVLVLAINHWRPYLIGRKFIIHTNQEESMTLATIANFHTSTLAWISKLMGYDFEITYKAGASNKVANAFSRCEEDMECQVISMPH